MVGAERQSADVDATDVSMVDVIGSKAVSAESAVTGCVESADSIRAICNRAVLALRVRAKKLRQWVQVSV